MMMMKECCSDREV